MAVANGKSQAKRLILSAISLALAILLLWLFFEKSGIGYTMLRQIMEKCPPHLLLAITVTTALRVFFAAWRWQYISKRTGIKGISFFFFYSNIILATFIGIVLPRQLALLAVRSVSLKVVSGKSLGRSGFSVIYDSLFSLYVPLVLVPVSICIVSGKSSLEWVLPAAAVTVLAIALPFILQKKLAALAISLYGRTRQLLPQLPPPPEKIEEKTLFERKCTMTVFILALMQFVCFMARDALTLYASGIDLGMLKVCAVSPLIYLSGLVGLTPDNFGVAEWIWTGVLGASGTALAAATTFAAASRLFDLASRLILTFIVFIIALIKKLTGKKECQ